ncbi:MAG: D-glycerate dehydrogenase [Candidatus Hydrogenedentes bacterium]|nr:D-glycerate dehydrogenase [Candidatus Hydrogenedentota bacterium]
MKIVITRRIPEAGVETLVHAFGTEQVRRHEEERPMTRAVLLDALRGATAVLCTITEKMDAEAMDAAGDQLKIIANMAVGYDNINLADAAARNILVTNTPGVLTEATADLAWALILGAARRTGEAERCLRAGLWEGWGPLQFLGASVHGKTLGIFGMGRIGRAVARRALGFDMPVLYCDTNRLDAETERQLHARLVDKDTLLRESDILTLHCPLTPETRHAFTLREFKQMKRGALIVNTSRGPVIKEEDLSAALREDLIFAAGLDVYEHEPAVHAALLKQEQAVLLPHLGSATVETRATMARMAAENIVAALSGSEPPNRVLLPS